MIKCAPYLRSIAPILVRASALLISLSSTTTAQSSPFQPFLTWASSSSYVDGQALYILGGFPLSTPWSSAPQAFDIDLSTSWSIDSPAYTQLPNGPPTFSMTSTLSSNGHAWFALVNGTGYLYDIPTKSWSTAITSNDNISTTDGLSASTDPHTGIVYIPNGYQEPRTNSMLTVNLDKNTYGSVPMPPNLNGSTILSTAWSNSMQSMVVYGGKTGNLFLYSPTNGWSDLTQATKGSVPIPRAGACFVPAYDGSKMILFGGANIAGNSSLNDIYMLDVATWTWTRGPDVALANGRAAMACAVSNKYLVAWGGVNVNLGNPVAPRNAALLFDLKNSAWTTEYLASAQDSWRSNTRLVAGLGALVGLLAMVFVLVAAALLRNRARGRRERVIQDVYKDKPKCPPHPTALSQDKSFEYSVYNKKIFGEKDISPSCESILIVLCPPAQSQATVVHASCPTAEQKRNSTAALLPTDPTEQGSRKTNHFQKWNDMIPALKSSPLFSQNPLPGWAKE